MLPVSLLATAVALVNSGLVYGQGALEEVVVTAQKRAESLQDVSVSVSVTSGEDIANAGVRTMEDLSVSLPAVNVSKGGASDQMYIRGIGSGFNGGFEQAVGTYVDGIYMGRSRGGRSSFVDMERVEVLKGPQSLYFGNSSIGGAISVTTRGPGEEFGGNIAVTYEPEYNGRNIEAGLDIPLSDDFAVRIALRKYDTDGYVEDTSSTGQSGDGPDTDDFVGRLSARWTPTDALGIRFKYTKGSSDIKHPFLGETFGCDASVSAGAAAPCPAHLAAGLPFDNQLDYRFQTSENDFSELDFQNATLNWDYDFGSVLFTSVTGYAKSENRDVQDLDTGILDIFHANQYDSVEQWSQEIRLASVAADDLEWMVGAYYQSGDVGYDGNLMPNFIPTIAGAAAASGKVIASRTDHLQEETTKSVFGSLTWSFRDDIRLGLGLRYTEVEKDISKEVTWGQYQDAQLGRDGFVQITAPFGGFATVGSASDSLSQDDILPSVMLEWDVLPEAMVYLSYAAGFKAGGFDFSSRNGNVTPSFDEELADAFELGLKGTWLDNTLRTNLALFYADYEGVQQSVVDAATFVFTVGNAAASSTAGFEADITWAATEQLTLAANVTLMDTVFEDYIGSCSQYQLDNSSCPGATVNGSFVANAQDLSDHETTFAPSYSGLIRATYVSELSEDLLLTIDGNVFFSDSYAIQSDFDPNTGVDSYAMLGGRIAISNEMQGWEFALVGKNLSDKKVPFFCNDLSASAGSYRCALNPPRTIAIQGKYSW